MRRIAPICTVCTCWQEYLMDPPESETDNYVLVHEDDIALLERFGLRGFRKPENEAMCVQVCPDGLC